jgi:hypothetical protein
MFRNNTVWKLNMKVQYFVFGVDRENHKIGKLSNIKPLLPPLEILGNAHFIK